MTGTSDTRSARLSDVSEGTSAFYAGLDKDDVIYKLEYNGANGLVSVDVNKWNGFVTYEDVFTFKKFKIIDIAMSKTLRLHKNMSYYIYNRVISYDDISFAIGIDNVMSSSNERLQKFIDEHNYNKCSDFSRCLILHNISKDEKNLDIEYDCW